MRRRLHLGMISRWIEQSERTSAPVLRLPLAQEDPESLSLAESTGILVSAGRLQEAECEGCEAGFVGKVRHEPGSGWMRDCLCLGPQPLAPEDVELVRYDRAGLFRELAKACGSSLPPPSDSVCVLVGAYQRSPQHRSAAVFYIESIARAENIALLLGMIQHGEKGPGIVVTHGEAAAALPLPKGFRVASLGTLFYGLNGRIHIDHAEASAKLGEPTTAARGRGRPDYENLVHQAWLELVAPAEELRSWAPKKQADHLIKNWPDHLVPRPSPTTIRKHVGKRAANWRDALESHRGRLSEKSENPE